MPLIIQKSKKPVSMRKLLFIFIISLFCGKTYTQESQYLHKVSLLNNDSFQEFAFLDTIAPKYKIFMTGENHSFVNFNTKLELKLLRYLNKTVGLRNFVLELGPARAHYMNLYITTGDSSAYKKLEATTGKNYLKFYRMLKNYNQSLPDSLKIKVWGVDVERFNDLATIWVSDLLPEQDIPDQIRIPVESIKSLGNYLISKGINASRTEYNSTWSFYDPNYVSTERSIKTFINYYDSLKLDFTQWLGNEKIAELDEAVLTLREYLQWEEYEGTTFQYNWREENIYRKYLKIIQNDPEGRFFGQFGRCHSSLARQEGECNWYHYNSVINRLVTRGDSTLKDKIFAVGIFYSNLTFYSSEGSARETDEERIAAKEEVEAITELTDDESLTFVEIQKRREDYPILNKRFQMVLVNNDYPITEDEFEDSIDDENYNYANYHSPWFIIKAGASTLNLNGLSNLNNTLNSINGSSLGKFIEAYYFELGTILPDIDEGPAVKFVGAYANLGPLIQNDSLSIKAHYYSFGEEFTIGFGGSNFLIGPTFGVNYSSMVLKQRVASDRLFQNNENNTQIFRNPSINLNLGLSLELRILRIFGIGAKFGYSADLSNQKWRQNGRTLDNMSEKFSHSGLYTTVTAGFAFPIE